MKINRDVVELLERSVDVKRLVRKLFFEADDLERAAVRQPELYLEAGRFRSQSALTVATLKRKLGKVTGEKAIKIRQKSRYKTEGAIKNQLSLSESLQAIQQEFDFSEVQYEFATQLTEAYKERLVVISILARIKASEINSEVRRADSDAVVKNMRSKANKVRRKFEDTYIDED